MITLDTKLYAQLQPDNVALAALLDAQRRLMDNGSGRAVPQAELHMTIIHIGKLHNAYDEICTVSTLTQEDFLSEATELSGSLEHHMSKAASFYRLEPMNVVSLGASGRTQAQLFRANAALTALHADCLASLCMFFQRCGVPDPEKFAEQSENFRFTLSLLPHVTLVKSFRGDSVTGCKTECDFSPMSVVY